VADKLVLVTGASGFVGQKLCQQLHRKGYQVYAMLHNMADGPWDESIMADLTSKLPAKITTNIDMVFHLAGKAHALTETRQDEEEYFQINTKGT